MQGRQDDRTPYNSSSRQRRRSQQAITHAIQRAAVAPGTPALIPLLDTLSTQTRELAQAVRRQRNTESRTARLPRISAPCEECERSYGPHYRGACAH